MEAISTRYPPFQRRLYTSSPPPPPPHCLGLNFRHHGGVDRRTAMGFQSLQRITTALNQSHRNPIQFSLTNTSYLDLSFDFTFHSAMDDFNAEKETESGDGLSVAKDTKETQKPSEIPPPPEKPLPGDCCGSGCVRCVWDVYIEELAEYNKLYKENNLGFYN